MTNTTRHKSIIRVIKDKENPYVQINRTCLNDNQLSWKAKGLLCYMLSMPDDWVFHREELAKHSSDGIAALKSALKELKEGGYITIGQIREGNKIIRWETLVFESPTLANRGSSLEVDFLPVENRQVENRPTTNTERLTKTERTKNEQQQVPQISKEAGKKKKDPPRPKQEPTKLTKPPEVYCPRLDSRVTDRDLIEQLNEMGYKEGQAMQLILCHGDVKVHAGVEETLKTSVINPKGFLSSWLAARKGVTLEEADKSREQDLNKKKMEVVNRKLNQQFLGAL